MYHAKTSCSSKINKLYHRSTFKSKFSLSYRRKAWTSNNIHQNTNTYAMPCVCINMNVDMIRFTQYKTHHKDERLHACQSQRMSSHDVSMSDGRMRLHRIDLLHRFCAPQQLAMMHVCRRGGDNGYYNDDDDGACGDDDG
jgi:hypothetical protein